ncbi:MAG: hypothetical protein ACTHL6_00475, partial [Arthrobacter sp.]
MTGKAASTVLSGATLVAAAVFLAACSGTPAGSPGWTAQPAPSGAAANGVATSGSPTQGATPGATGSSAGSTSATPAAPEGAATAAAWKTFSDSAKTVSFDLPADWIAQSVPPEEGVLPGGLKVDVKKPDGTFVAALR